MEALLDLISNAFSYPFMQRAILTAILTGTVCAVLSCYLVLKGWSLMGDAISHAVLPGVALAFWLGIPITIGAFFSGIFCALTTGYLKENSRIKEDAVMGIVFSGMFALGIVLFSRMNTEQHLSHILFGDLLGVTTSELTQTLFITIVTLLIILTKRKEFMLYCFDPHHAKVIGLSVKLLHYSLLCLLALTIVVSIQAVGVILVIAMLIAPGIIAFMLCRSFDRMLITAVVVSIAASCIGVFVSFYINGATGPCIVIIQSLFFILALLYHLFNPVKSAESP